MLIYIMICYLQGLGVGLETFSFVFTNNFKKPLRNFSSFCSDNHGRFDLPLNIEVGHSVNLSSDITKAINETVFSYRIEGTDFHLVTYFNIMEKKFLVCIVEEADPLLREMEINGTLTDSGTNRVQVSFDDLDIMNENAWQAEGRTEKRLEIEGMMVKFVMKDCKMQLLLSSASEKKEDTESTEGIETKEDKEIKEDAESKKDTDEITREKAHDDETGDDTDEDEDENEDEDEETNTENKKGFKVI